MIDLDRWCNAGEDPPVVHVLVLSSQGPGEPWRLCRLGGSFMTMEQNFGMPFEVDAGFATLANTDDTAASFCLEDPTVTHLFETCSAGDVAVILDHADFAVESNRD